MVELLAGVATNSPLAVEAAEELEGMALTALDAEARPPAGAPTVNELIIAVDPTVLFGGGGGGGGDGGSGGTVGCVTSEAFTDRVEVLLRAVQASAADPSDEGALRLPSDRRYAQRLKTLERGRRWTWTQSSSRTLSRQLLWGKGNEASRAKISQRRSGKKRGREREREK